MYQRCKGSTCSAPPGGICLSVQKDLELQQLPGGQFLSLEDNKHNLNP